MARRPTYIKELDPLSPAIEKHILVLGFTQSANYIDWCWANGFEGSIDKSKTDMLEESDAFNKIAAQKVKQQRLHKNPKQFFKAVCFGELISDEIDRPNFKMIAAEIENSNESVESRQSLYEMLLVLLKEKDLIFDSTRGRAAAPYLRGLIKLHDRKVLWLRPIEDWKPKSRNSDRKFGELTHHLFDKYGDIPIFMERVWLRNDRPSWRYRDWYVHLGRGHNLRAAKTPVSMTKKMVHHFLQAPNDYTPEQAIRWGQLKALGAAEAAIEAIIATRLGQSFEHESFWFTVFRFIADNPMLDPRQIGPLVDYLQYQKYQTVEVEFAPGEWRREPALQPGLSMTGRTVDTLLRQVADWHDELGRASDMSDTPYREPSFKGLDIERRSASQARHWTINRLRNVSELQQESKVLHHCVASYHWSCVKGHCSIWSLQSSTDGMPYQRHITIELAKDGTIVQCRGLANRSPRADEWAIIETWASKAGLEISTYLN